MQDAVTDSPHVSRGWPSGDAAELDGEALDRLIRDHGERVVSMCRALLRSDADAQDAAQETFVRCLPMVAELAGNVGPFLNTVARNICRDELRRRGRQAVTSEIGDRPAAAANPETTVVHRQTLGALWRDLSENDRRLLGYRIVGFRCEEIAELLGVSVSTVTSGLSRAYRRAQTAMAASDGESAWPPAEVCTEPFRE